MAPPAAEHMSYCAKRLGPLGRPIVLALVVLPGWGAALCSPQAHAASEAILFAARACAELDWRDKGGYERAKTWREAVRCLRDLYVRVAAGERPDGTFEKELAKRLDALEAAYRRSRDICGLRQQLKLDHGGCGTIGLASGEFVSILKTMILNEDAGWGRRDPSLAEALRLEE